MQVKLVYQHYFLYFRAELRGQGCIHHIFINTVLVLCFGIYIGIVDFFYGRVPFFGSRSSVLVLSILHTTRSDPMTHNHGRARSSVYSWHIKLICRPRYIYYTLLVNTYINSILYNIMLHMCHIGLTRKSIYYYDRSPLIYLFPFYQKRSIQDAPFRFSSACNSAVAGG